MYFIDKIDIKQKMLHSIDLYIPMSNQGDLDGEFTLFSDFYTIFSILGTFYANFELLAP